MHSYTGKLNMAKCVRISLARLSLAALGIGGLLIFAASCGGGGAQAEGPKAASSEQVQEEDLSGPKKEAQERFGKLSKQLDELDDEKPVNMSWLESELKEILKLNPQHLAARFNLAVIAEKRGDKKAARAMYEEIADDGFGPAADNLAAFYVEEGEIDDAVEIYEERIAADPKALTARLGLARIMLEAKKYKEAIKHSKKVLQRKADAIEAFRILAESYRATGDIAMAQLVIGRGLNVDKDDVDLHYLTGKILLEEGKLSEGVAKLKHVIRLQPSWLKPRAELAEISLKYYDFGNAAQQYEAILKERKNDIPTKLGLAVAYKGLGRHDQAEKLYKEILTAEPGNVRAVWNLAVLYHRHMQRYDEAIALFQKAQSEGPPPGVNGKQIRATIAQVKKEKADVAARKAREERERKRLAAIDAACQAIAAGRKPKAGEIGNDQERIQAAWDLLLVKAVGEIQAGNVEAGKAAAECALGIVPKTPGAGMVACAQLRVNWVQIQDQVGMLMDMEGLEAARATMDEAVECDPENPDAQLFRQQIDQLIQQQQMQQQAGQPGVEGGEGVPPAAGVPQG